MERAGFEVAFEIGMPEMWPPGRERRQQHGYPKGDEASKST
jgi:hypothetical protein